MQLKIENQSLNEKIEERNEELLKLRKKTTVTVQVSLMQGRCGSGPRSGLLEVHVLQMHNHHSIRLEPRILMSEGLRHTEGISTGGEPCLSLLGAPGLVTSAWLCVPSPLTTFLGPLLLQCADLDPPHCSFHAQILTHVREKLLFVEKENGSLAGQLEGLDHELVEKRDRLGKVSISLRAGDGGAGPRGKVHSRRGAEAALLVCTTACRLRFRDCYWLYRYYNFLTVALPVLAEPLRVHCLNRLSPPTCMQIKSARDAQRLKGRKLKAGSVFVTNPGLLDDIEVQKERRDALSTQVGPRNWKREMMAWRGRTHYSSIGCGMPGGNQETVYLCTGPASRKNRCITLHNSCPCAHPASLHTHDHAQVEELKREYAALAASIERNNTRIVSMTEELAASGSPSAMRALQSGKSGRSVRV